MLPPTLAETSKSGDGYHLFYLVDEEWDDEKGYGLLGDRIGIEQGVDIRATGCVYHHPQQRWNDRGRRRLCRTTCRSCCCTVSRRSRHHSQDRRRSWQATTTWRY